MQEKDKPAFAALMTGVAENYGQTITPQGIALRFKLLAPYPIAEVEAAAYSLLATRKYTTMPTVADFLERLGGGSVEDKAEVACSKALEAASVHGAYRSVVFDDPVLQAVVNNNFGGWPKFCQLPVDKWLRKDFCEAYAAYARQGFAEHGYMPGLCEIDNAAKGLAQFAEPPAMIGAVDACKAVLQGASCLAISEALPFVVELAAAKEVQI